MAQPFDARRFGPRTVTKKTARPDRKGLPGITDHPTEPPPPAVAPGAGASARSNGGGGSSAGLHSRRTKKSQAVGATVEVVTADLRKDPRAEED